MVQTKLSYRFWLHLSAILILLVFWIVSIFLGHSLTEKWIPGLFLLAYLLGNGFLLFPFRQYIVDSDSHCLIVRCYFPRRQTVVPFSDFDAVISTSEGRMRGGPVSVLLFQKDGKTIYRLTGDLYKNLFEVEEHLLGLSVIKKERHRFNWEKLGFRRDRGSLMWAGILCLASAVAMLFLYFDKEKIKSKKDITFISGPFEKYNWVDLGGRNGSSLTFKLQNYSNRFKIKAEFFSILQTDKFKTIPNGDTLTIGIPNGFAKYLNTPKQPFFVYSIASNDLTYLDLKDAIAKHNSPLFLLATGLFVTGGCTFIYYGRRAKVKTPIW
jgi:hypothetical protein